jgi:hypothetical protein
VLIFLRCGCFWILDWKFTLMRTISAPTQIGRLGADRGEKGGFFVHDFTLLPGFGHKPPAHQKLGRLTTNLSAGSIRQLALL